MADEGMRRMSGARPRRFLTFYDRFERGVIFILTLLMMVVIVATLWKLVLNIAGLLASEDIFAFADHQPFQSVFGAIFTVMIALEFKRSILIAAHRSESVFQVQRVVMIALLAVLRKFIILEPGPNTALAFLSLGAGALALGGVYWLIGRRDRAREAGTGEEAAPRDWRA